MNTTHIMQKCLDELSKEAPRLDYVMGMLETAIAVSAPPVVGTTAAAPAPTMLELDKNAKAAIEAIREAEMGHV